MPRGASGKRRRHSQQQQAASQPPNVVPPRHAAAQAPVATATPPPKPPGPLVRLRRKLRDIAEVLFIPALIVGPLLLIVLIGISPQFISLLHQETVTDTVVKSERVNSGESGKYLVFGKEEVYQNTDSFPLLKFRSSDFYRDIEVGKTYHFKVVGWRIPLFSSYRNIVGFEEVELEAE
jgi:hypothetical protein